MRGIQPNNMCHLDYPTKYSYSCDQWVNLVLSEVTQNLERTLVLTWHDVVWPTNSSVAAGFVASLSNASHRRLEKPSMLHQTLI